MEKFEYASMKKFLADAHRNGPNRMSSKMVESCGRLYFKRMTDAEWDKAKEIAFPKLEGVHTVEQIQRVMEEKMVHEFDYFNNAPYLYIMIPDYSPTESRILSVQSHTIGDGVGFWSFFASIGKDQDFAGLPRVYGIHWLPKLIYWIFAPIFWIQLQIDVNSLPKSLNPMRLQYPCTKERAVRFYEDIPLDLLKKRCKEQGATINEACQAVLALTIRRYFKLHNAEDIKKYNLSTTFSNRQTPTCKEEMEVSNDVALLTYGVELKENLQDQIKEAKRKFQELKGGRFLIAHQLSCRIMSITTNDIYREGLKEFS